MDTNTNGKKAKILAYTLDNANSKILEKNKSPSRKVGEPDNRHSHFFLAKYWSEALASQNEDKELKILFTKFNKELETNEKNNPIMNKNVMRKKIGLSMFFHH